MKASTRPAGPGNSACRAWMGTADAQEQCGHHVCEGCNQADVRPDPWEPPGSSRFVGLTPGETAAGEPSLDSVHARIVSTWQGGGGGWMVLVALPRNLFAPGATSTLNRLSALCSLLSALCSRPPSSRGASSTRGITCEHLLRPPDKGTNARVAA